MSPNGKRRWRKAAKKCRRWLRTHYRRNEPWPFHSSYARYRDACPAEVYEKNLATMRAASMRRHGFMCSEDGSVSYFTSDGHSAVFSSPERPFSPRSLVGMSMGARKRAARCAAVKHPMRKRVKLVWFKCWARDMHRRIMTIDDEMAQRRYDDARARYRIGERLRPCPGCCTCWGADSSGEDVNKRGRSRRELRAYRKWSATLADDCDGSGVLPARRPK